MCDCSEFIIAIAVVVVIDMCDCSEFIIAIAAVVVVCSRSMLRMLLLNFPMTVSSLNTVFNCVNGSVAFH